MGHSHLAAVAEARMRARARWLCAATSVLAMAASLSGCHAAAGPRVTVVQTTRGLSQRLTHLRDVRFGSVPRDVPIIAVSDARRYQRFTGLGAAITDSAAWLLETQLSPAGRAAVLQRLFSASGLDLQTVRVPMAASDYTVVHPYTYDDLPPGRSDPALAHFSITHDQGYILPLLRRVLRIDPAVRLLSAPWSPPAWMKTNDTLDNLGEQGRLKHTDFAPLAGYFVRFLDAYARAGVPVAEITPQNEPGHVTRYPGLDLSAADEATFVVHDLEPALASTGLHPRLLGLDASWSRVADARRLLADRAFRRAIAGLAWHCYGGNPTAMAAMHTVAPALEQLVSECATGIAPGPTAELLIASLRNWASGVVLWNVALDRRGGPVPSPNSGCRGCSGVVTVDEHTQRVSYTSDYYELGQLSRFVRPGAWRIASNHFVTYNSVDLQYGPDYAGPGLDDVALENPDGSKVLLAHNTGSRPIRFAVAWKGRAFTYALPASATVTFTWR